MLNSMRYNLGLLFFAVGVFAVPYRRYELDNDSSYNADNFDVVYDQRQNGTENYKLSVDGLSLVWSPNSLLAAAALLEPALYGEYPDTNVDIILGPDPTKPVVTSSAKPETDNDKPIEKESGKLKEENDEKPLESAASPTILVIDGNQLTGQKQDNPETVSKRKLRLPGLLRPFLRKRTSMPSKSLDSST